MVRQFSFVASLLAADASFDPGFLQRDGFFDSGSPNVGTTSTSFVGGGFVISRRPANPLWQASDQLGRARATLDVAATSGPNRDVYDIPPYRFRGWLVAAIPATTAPLSASARQELRLWSQSRLTRQPESASDLELFAVPAMAAILEQPNASSPAIASDDVYTILLRARRNLARAAEQFGVPLPGELLIGNGRLLAAWSAERELSFLMRPGAIPSVESVTGVVVSSCLPPDCVSNQWQRLGTDEIGLFASSGRLQP